MSKRSETLKQKIENTEFLATKEPEKAIYYINIAYELRNKSIAREIYKIWREIYLKDITRY